MQDSRVDTLLNESISLERSGQIGAALERARRALEEAQASDDAEGRAGALVRLGNIHYWLGHYAEARAIAEQALTHAGPWSRNRADALILMGICAFETDSLAEAESRFLAADDLCRQIGYDQTRFRALHNLACIYSLRGQFSLSLAADEEAYRIACELDLPQKPAPLIAITFMCLLTGQYPRARATLDELAPIVSATPLYQGYYCYFRAWLAQEEGDWPAAASFYTQARSIAETIGDPALHIFIRMGQSRYYQMAGNASAARQWANDAVAWASRVGNQRMLGRTLIERGRTAWLNGDPDAAESDLRNAIQELDARQQFYDLAHAYLLLAAILFRQGRPEADHAWLEAVSRIVSGGYGFLLERERAMAFPLIAHYLNSGDPYIQSTATRLLGHLERVPPPPLRVVTLGRFEVWRNRRRVESRALRHRRAGELLAVLLLAPGRSLSFEQIAEALWPDKPPGAAQTAFHHATSALRRALEPDLPEKFPSRYLEVEEGQAVLHLPSGSWVDVDAFEAHCRQAEWEEALALYGGEFLPEYRYADWTIIPRECLLLLYQQALLEAARARLAAGQFAEALEACRRLLALEPWHEEAALLGMRACVALNDLPGARRLYLALEKALREDLGTIPQEELRSFYRSLTPPVDPRRQTTDR